MRPFCLLVFNMILHPVQGVKMLAVLWVNAPTERISGSAKSLGDLGWHLFCGEVLGFGLLLQIHSITHNSGQIIAGFRSKPSRGDPVFRRGGGELDHGTGL